MRLTLLIITLILLTFSGCRSNYAKLQPTIEKEPLIQLTKTGALIKEGQTIVTLHATHLNAADRLTYDDGEYFFIGLYISGENPDAEKSGLSNPDFTLRLNREQKPLDITVVGKDSEMYRDMPVLNRWGHHYKVKFPRQKEISILTYTHKTYGKTELKFDPVY